MDMGIIAAVKMRYLHILLRQSSAPINVRVFRKQRATRHV